MKNLIEEQIIQTKAATRLYLEAEKDALKLRLAKHMSKFATTVAVSFISIGFVALCLVMLLVALGFALGEYYGSNSIGFLCSSGLAVIISIIALPLLKKLILKPILKIILNQLFDE